MISLSTYQYLFNFLSKSGRTVSAMFRLRSLVYDTIAVRIVLRIVLFIIALSSQSQSKKYLWRIILELNTLIGSSDDS